MADWQDLPGGMPQDSTSSSDPREEIPKGDLECGACSQSMALTVASCTQKVDVGWVTGPHMSPSPWSDLVEKS